MRKNEFQKNPNIFCISLRDTSSFLVPFATIQRFHHENQGDSIVPRMIVFLFFIIEKKPRLNVSFRSGGGLFSFYFKTRALYSLYISSVASRALATMAFSLGKQ